MPDAVVAVIELKDGRVGILPFPKAYEIHLEEVLEGLGRTQKVDFPGYHTNTLPTEIRGGTLGELADQQIIDVNSDKYTLHIYTANFKELYQKLIGLSH